MHSSYANETNAPANIPANIPPNANAVTATFGLDWHARDNLHLGLAFSVTREIQNFTSTVLASGPGISTVFAPGGSSVAKYGGLLAIASWDSKDNWMINGYAGWMYGTLNISRGVTTITLVPGGDPTVPGDSFASPLFVNASPNASRLLGGLALDVSFPMGRWEWRGSVGFDAMRTSINAYEEQGISGFELAVPTHIVESDRGRLDIALARTFSTRWFVWQPEFRAGLRLEFAHDASTIGVRFIEDTRGTLINLDSAALDPDWGEADFSTVFTFKHGYSAFLRLGREFGHSTSTATFYAIGGRIEF